MFVYTFWEPRDSIPHYLRLCMETWKKFLPNATIVLLDYKNLGDFLDVRELGLNLFADRRFSPMHVADALRVALLAKRGGIWLDLDTIILSSDAEKFFLPDEKHRTTFFGSTDGAGCYTAFINAPPSSVCMGLWREFNREKLWNLSNASDVGWDFFSNAFINDYAQRFRDEIKIFDSRPVMPEVSAGFVSNAAAYVEFYFLKSFRLEEVKAPLLLLHNSWTPPFFKRLSPTEFARLDCTIVNVLAEALGLELPAKRNRIRLVTRESVEPNSA